MNAPDRIDAMQQVFVHALTHPATWLPFVPIAAAYAFIGMPWWLCLPLALVVMTIVCLAWTRRWPMLMERARSRLLKTYRDTENTDLNFRLSELAASLAHLPTKRLLYDLREAMEIKHAIEKRLFADDTITPHEEEVGEMVADSVRTMLIEAEKVPLMESTQWPGSTAKVEKALESLRRVFENIDVILDPLPEGLRLPAENDALARASERLEESLEQARGVRRHLERDVLMHEEPPPLPDSAPRQSATES